MSRLPRKVAQLLVRIANAADLRAARSRCGVRRDAQAASALYLETSVVARIDGILKWSSGAGSAHDLALDLDERKRTAFRQERSAPDDQFPFAALTPGEDRFPELLLAKFEDLHTDSEDLFHWVSDHADELRALVHSRRNGRRAELRPTAGAGIDAPRPDEFALRTAGGAAIEDPGAGPGSTTPRGGQS